MDRKVARKGSGSTRHFSEASLYAPGGDRKYVSPAERRRVLNAADGLDADHALFAQMLVWTGARVSEVLALTPVAFRIEEGVVAIATLKRRKHAIREVPLPAGLMAALDRAFHLREAQADPERSRKRLWPWHRATAWRFIHHLMASVQIAGVRAAPRGLRHGFGIAALQAGVPLNILQRWLGHARMTTTSIYADALGPEERAIAERLWRRG